MLFLPSRLLAFNVFANLGVVSLGGFASNLVFGHSS
jgi:hypothetical protein